MNNKEYINGMLLRRRQGYYEGHLCIEGVDISPIEATFFKDENNDTILWIKRKPLLEYDEQEHKYKKRMRRPQWEVYLSKKKNMNDTYVGEFMFLRFKFTIIAQWDNITYEDKYRRMNIIIERAPMAEQTIINSINANKKQDRHARREHS